MSYCLVCMPDFALLQASGDGGLNIEPEAWENKDAKKNGRPVSRFPAQACFAACFCSTVCFSSIAGFVFWESSVSSHGEGKHVLGPDFLRTAN